MQKVSDLEPNTYFWLQIQNQHEILYQKILSFAFRPSETSLLPLLAGVNLSREICVELREIQVAQI